MVVKSASRFYKLYPGRDTEQAKRSKIRRVLWENLALFCAVVIDRNDEGKREIITMDYERGGLFVKNDNEKD